MGGGGGCFDQGTSQSGGLLVRMPANQLIMGPLTPKKFEWQIISCKLYAMKNGFS